VSSITDTEELIAEVTKMMNSAMVSNVTIFSPTKKALKGRRHPDTNPSHDSKSVCTKPTVDTNDSLDCTNDDDDDDDDDDVILSISRDFLNSFLILNKRCLPLDDLPIVGQSDKNDKGNNAW
jgi:hypothetical protein